MPEGRGVTQVRGSAIGAALLLLALDLVTKWVAHRGVVLAGVDPVRNDRLALSLDLGLSMAMITILSMVAGAGWLFLLRRNAEPMAHVAAVFFAAGLVGNWLDRVALGGVRDWLVIGPTRWNLADVWLLVGLVLGAAVLIRAELALRPTTEGR